MPENAHQEVQLVGHGGLLDALAQALAALGGEVSQLGRTSSDPEAYVSARSQMARIDAVRELMRDALMAGVAREQNGELLAHPHFQQARRDWAQRVADDSWTTVERSVLRLPPPTGA